MTEQLRLPPRVKQFEDERVLGRWRASRTQSSLRLVHGHLYLTTRRLVFAPYDWDAALSGVYLQCGLNGILGLGRQERDTSQVLGGSLRERLWIEYDDFSVERFRVKNIDGVIAQIRAAANLS
jgi:hypothetical protein